MKQSTVSVFIWNYRLSFWFYSTLAMDKSRRPDIKIKRKRDSKYLAHGNSPCMSRYFCRVGSLCMQVIFDQNIKEAKFTIPCQKNFYMVSGYILRAINQVWRKENIFCFSVTVQVYNKVNTSFNSLLPTWIN